MENHARSSDDERPDLVYHVRYSFGTYSGTRTVYAESGEVAIAKVRAWARGQSSLSMAAESYRVVAVHP
jgi:hypothetical protein